jgi:hypothetical protein
MSTTDGKVIFNHQWNTYIETLTIIEYSIMMVSYHRQWCRKQNEFSMAKYLHGERVEREPVRGSGSRAPSWVLGQSPGRGQGGFNSIHVKINGDIWPQNEASSYNLLQHLFSLTIN